MKHAQGAEVDVFSAHDIPEFERLSGRSAALAVDRAATPDRRARAQRRAEPRLRKVP